MRKLFIAAFAVLSFGLANAQESGFKAGAHVGLPIGTSGDLSSLTFGVDLAYMHSVSDDFQVGGTAGYTMFMGKDIPFIGKLNYGFALIGAAATYKVADSFFVGLDLGYAIGVSEVSGGDLYYHPKVGYAAESFEVTAGYRGIGSGFSAPIVGFAYKF
jgi:hypothetical protein